MEGLVRKGGNGLKVVTQAGFPRVRIPHDDLIEAKKHLFPRKVDLGHRLQKDIISAKAVDTRATDSNAVFICRPSVLAPRCPAKP
jgi:hypothetical protein